MLHEAFRDTHFADASLPTEYLLMSFNSRKVRWNSASTCGRLRW